MTVSQVAQNKIKICLTHTEVIACFGEYEKLLGLSPKVKALLNLLLSDIISKHSLFNGNKKISAKIKLCKNFGCEITLTALTAKRKIPNTECVFEFSDADALTGGILELYKNKANLRFLSHLYKTANGYSLIVNCKKPKERLFFLNEFCFNIESNIEYIAYTKEYGKPLILNCAIEKYGNVFLKFP